MRFPQAEPDVLPEPECYRSDSTSPTVSFVATPPAYPFMPLVPPLDKYFVPLDVYENEVQLPGDARHALLPRPPTASGSTSYHLQEPFRPPPHPRSLYDAPPFHDAQPFVYVPPTLPQPGAYHTSSYQHHFSPPYYLEANAGSRSLYAPVVPPQPGHQLLANYAGGPAHIPPPPLQFDSTFKPAAAPFPPVAEPPKKKKAPRRPSTQKFPCPHPHCDSVFSRAFNLHTHTAAHAGIRNFDCSHCVKKFSRRHDRARHIAAVHGISLEDQALAENA